MMVSKLLTLAAFLLVTFSFANAQSAKWISARLTSQPFQTAAAQSIVFGDTVFYKYSNNHRKLAQLGFGFGKIKENGWFSEWSIVGVNATVQDNVQLQFSSNQNITEPQGGYKATNLGLALRWEYGRLLGDFENSKFVPAISMSVDPYFDYLKIIPKTSEGFPMKSIEAGSIIQFIPRLEYRIYKNISLDVSIAVPLGNLRFEYDKLENPVLPIDLQRQNKVDGSLLPVRDTQIRLGLLYRICDNN